MNEIHTSKTVYIALGILAVVSLGLHLYRISYPAAPVFDEIHFATYATDYLEHRPFFDIHPPLGKLFYAATLGMFSGGGFDNRPYIVIKNNPKTNELDFTFEKTDFQNFPYIPLRTLGAIFGVLLALAMYGFLRSLGIGEVGALLGAFLVVFDNALMLETRLIMLNGMFLVFGLGALTLYFRRPQWPVGAGLLMGMSLAVKLIGVVFLIPIEIFYHLRNRFSFKPLKYSSLKFIGTACIVYLLIYSVNPILYGPSQEFSLWGSLHLFGDEIQLATSSPAVTHQGPLAYIGASLLENTLYFAGYTGLAAAHPKPHVLQSRWYFWPVMQIPMNYYEDSTAPERKLVLLGNPMVWLSGTLAVIFSIALLGRFFKKKTSFNSKELGESEKRGFFILLGGYLGSMLPFFSIVERTTFLYHYFPALLFSIGLLAWFLEQLFEFGNFVDLNRKQITALSVICLIVVAGFLIIAPYTYGTPSPFF